MKSVTSNPSRLGGMAMLASLAFTSLLLASCGGDEAEGAGDGGGASVTLRAGHVLAESEPHHQIILEVADRVAERTEGRVTIEVFSSSQLGAEREVMEQASLGDSVIAWGGMDQVGRFAVPQGEILLGPYLFENPTEDFQTFAHSDLMKEWQDEAADKGLRILAQNWYFGDRHIISNQGFDDPADLQRVKVRVPPSPVFLGIFEALQAAPTTLEWSEVYTGLSQGVVDAAEAPLTTIYGSSLFEVASTVTLSAHINSSVGWTMSEDVFQTLSEADQEVLVEEFLSGGEQARDMYLEQQDAVMADLHAEGVTFVEPDLDQYREATASFYDQFPDWPDGLLESVRAAVGQ